MNGPADPAAVRAKRAILRGGTAVGQGESRGPLIRRARAWRARGARA